MLFILFKLEQNNLIDIISLKQNHVIHFKTTIRKYIVYLETQRKIHKYNWLLNISCYFLDE